MSLGEKAKRLRIDGRNGAGKTNLLRYFEVLTKWARRRRVVKRVEPIYVYAPGESYFDIHEQIVEKLCKVYLGDLLRVLGERREEIARLSKAIPQAGEILRGIEGLVGGRDALFVIYSERHEDTVIRWLKGQRLTAVEKGTLTCNGVPPSNIESAALAIRFLDGLLRVLRELDLCEGVVLLFDEFEEIFEGLSRSRQSRYAQDLRHLFDTLSDSVFFVTATVPEPQDLEQYPAIWRRLGEPLEIEPIRDSKLAIEFVADYLSLGRQRYRAHLEERGLEVGEHEEPRGLEPLSEQMVEEEYRAMRKEVGEAGLDVLPGFFLPRMRERLKRTVEDDG